MLPTICTPRLCLRAIVPADAPGLFAVFSDPEVVRYWSAPPLVDLAEAAAYAEHLGGRAREGLWLAWGIVRAGEERLIGTCTLADIDAAHRRASLGYALARAAWGQGLAREAASAIVEHGFTALELHRIGADVDPRNGASLRLLRDLGFVHEGVQRECYHVMGEWQDAVMFGLLRRDWRGSGAAAKASSQR